MLAGGRGNLAPTGIRSGLVGCWVSLGFRGLEAIREYRLPFTCTVFSGGPFNPTYGVSVLLIAIDSRDCRDLEIDPTACSSPRLHNYFSLKTEVLYSLISVSVSPLLVHVPLSSSSRVEFPTHGAAKPVEYDTPFESV